MALINQTIFHQRDAETPVVLWVVSAYGDLASLINAKEGDIGFVLDGSIYRRDVGGSGWTIKFDPSVGGGGSVWGSITGTLGSQSDLVTALAAKAGLVHTHVEGDVTNLTSDLAGKAALVHSHTEADVTGLVSDLAGKQPLATPLTTIAGLAQTTDNFLVAAASAWASRTPAQAKTSLALVKGDVGLGSVDNTADTAKPVSTAQQTALDGKQNVDADLTTIAGLTATTDNFMVAVANAWASRTVAQAKTTLLLDNVNNTSDAAKPVSTATQTALDLKANLAGPTFTGTVTLPGPTINDGTNITISATTGTIIGQAGSKIGFYGIAPAVRPTTLTQTYNVASATHPAVTQLACPAGGTGLAAGAWSTAANRDLAIASINAGAADLLALKKFVNQLVDQLQAIGLLQ